MRRCAPVAASSSFPLCDQGGRAALMRELDSLAQKLPRLTAPVVAAEQRAQIDEGARMLEAGRRVREYLDRLAQQLFPGLSALDKAERTQRDADRARRAPASRECEFLARERSCLFGPSELMQSERRL